MIDVRNRSELRDICVKVLYQVYILSNTNVKYDVNTLIKEQLEVENEFVNELVNGVIKHQKEISKIANMYLKDWTIDRLSKVDKAILSIGIYELLYTKTPSIVCINETIELAKNYSDNEVVAFNLASLTAIKEEVLPKDKVVIYILNTLDKYYNNILKDRYGITKVDNDIELTLDLIGKKRGCLVKGGAVDYDKVYSIVMNDIKSGIIKGITFDRFEDKL